MGYHLQSIPFFNEKLLIIREGKANVYLKLLRVIICESYVFTIIFK